MNRGVLRTDADLRNEDGAALLWTGTTSGYQVTPLNAGPTLGASVSWPASANTLTGWTEITSSSPFACCAIDVYMSGHQQASVNTALLFDIGTGAGGSESVLIDGIPYVGHNRFLSIRFPVRVAASTRFAFRVQAATASGSLTAPASPTVALGFIRDIPEFPAGTSVQTIGSVDRANSVYTTIGLAAGQQRRVWRIIGDIPTGKAIYLISMVSPNTGALQSTATLWDYGWTPAGGQAYGTQVDGVQEVYCADQFTYTDASENWNPVVPTVWVPDGYVGGAVAGAVDTSNIAATERPVVFAVME